MKKYIPHLLIAYFLLMLAVPGYLVYRHYDTFRTGESYKVEVEPYDPYDPFRGRYVALSIKLPDYYGYGEYVRDLHLDRYYMNEKMAPEAERLQRNLDLSKDSMFLLVKVKNGHYVIQGLYFNEIPIEEYLTKR